MFSITRWMKLSFTEMGKINGNGHSFWGKIGSWYWSFHFIPFMYLYCHGYLLFLSGSTDVQTLFDHKSVSISPLRKKSVVSTLCQCISQLCCVTNNPPNLSGLQSQTLIFVKPKLWAGCGCAPCASSFWNFCLDTFAHLPLARAHGRVQQ